ncbi:MAG TPA: DNA-binding response regulator [Peptococcaceae bacterium]|nr:DNA-binding response regulator [Peptococcaceae bacterium]HQD54828.1 DNA-binding response regulator [Peptococcaceae bacterium]
MQYEAELLLINDEPQVIDAFQQLLRDEKFRLFYASNYEETLKIIQSNRIDIVLCNQNLPGMLGVDILRNCKKILPEAVRILMSDSPDLSVAISAINQGRIFYYLVKPWDDPQIVPLLKDALAYKREQDKKRLAYEFFRYYNGQLLNGLDKVALWEDDSIILINIAEILYLTAIDGHVKIITKKGAYNSQESLKAWHQRLEQHRFFRCHRSYIINLDYLERITPWFNGTYLVHLKDKKEKIPVSRKGIKELKQLLHI